MPYRRSYRKKRPRRKPRGVNRRRSKNQPTSLRLRGVTGFPDNMYVTLPYIETLTFDANAFEKFEWAVNNLIDVNLSGTGHQPHYFDEYTNLYDRWYVSHVTCRMEIINQSASLPVTVVMFPSPNITVLTQITKAEEQPHSKSVLVGTLGQNKAHLYVSMSTKKIRGETVMDNSFSGQTQVFPPVRQWYMETVLQSSDGVSATNVVIRFNFRFAVRFFKRRSNETS